MAAISPSRAPARIGPTIVRVLAIVVGGYAASASLATALAVALPSIAGLSRADACILGGMAGFLAYLALALWAAAQRALLVVIPVLVGLAIGGAIVAAAFVGEG